MPKSETCPTADKRAFHLAGWRHRGIVCWVLSGWCEHEGRRLATLQGAGRRWLLLLHLLLSSRSATIVLAMLLHLTLLEAKEASDGRS